MKRERFFPTEALPQSGRSLWDAPASPSTRLIENPDTTGNSRELADQIPPARSGKRLLRVYARTDLDALTRLQSTG